MEAVQHIGTISEPLRHALQARCDGLLVFAEKVL